MGAARAIGGVAKHEDQSTDVLLDGFRNIHDYVALEERSYSR